MTGKKLNSPFTHNHTKWQPPTECRVVSLEVFDLDENNFVELPRVFSRWSHLKDVKIDKIDAPIGNLIGNDAPRALEPKEVKECQERGPYAVRTIFGWTINGPLGRSGRSITPPISFEPITRWASSLRSSVMSNSTTLHSTENLKCPKKIREQLALWNLPSVYMMDIMTRPYLGVIFLLGYRIIDFWLSIGLA